MGSVNAAKCKNTLRCGRSRDRATRHATAGLSSVTEPKHLRPSPRATITMNDDYRDELTSAETLYWAECFAWMMLVMTPIIWWLQGPSVSTDQFVVRKSLLVISGVAAIGLRIAALRRRRRSAPYAQPPAEPAPPAHPRDKE